MRSTPPLGYHSLNPYLTAPDPDLLAAFVVEALDGAVTERLTDDAGAALHVQVVVGDSTLMIGRDDRMPAPVRGAVYLYVDEPERLFHQCVDAGASVLYPMAEMSYGDRSGGVTDPIGHHWFISQRLEGS